MQSDLFEEHKPQLPADQTAELHRQLVKLGDMLGDGLGDEPGGAWIRQDYRRVMKALGHDLPKKAKPNRNAEINERMAQRVTEVQCLECGGALKQTRSGSMKARCTSCRAGFTLLKIPKRKK